MCQHRKRDRKGYRPDSLMIDVIFEPLRTQQFAMGTLYEMIVMVTRIFNLKVRKRLGPLDGWDVSDMDPKLSNSLLDLLIKFNGMD